MSKPVVHPVDCSNGIQLDSEQLRELEKLIDSLKKGYNRRERETASARQDGTARVRPNRLPSEEGED
jgi:hypothetical protein